MSLAMLAALAALDADNREDREAVGRERGKAEATRRGGRKARPRRAVEPRGAAKRGWERKKEAERERK